MKTLFRWMALSALLLVSPLNLAEEAITMTVESVEISAPMADVSIEALAEAAAAVMLDSGDTAWMLVATVLVLFMTIPGLALFYGGMVRSKNVLSVLMQCFAITSLITVLWMMIDRKSVV